jgi:hypothetical protein
VGRAFDAGRIIGDRDKTGGCIVGGRCVAIDRIKTDRTIIEPNRETEAGIITLSSIVSEIACI